MTVKAIYEDGVFKPKEPVALEDKAEVELEIKSTHPPTAQDDDDPTGWKAAREFIGMWKGGTPGEAVGEDHDEYLYKRK